jgi:hypothetical protein
MFEFGRDLRKLFEKARESDDLGWLELIGAGLVEAEAKALSTDAGRVSCARPFDAWMRASTLWREHARRTGIRNSLDRAARAASDARRHALGADQAAAAGLEALEIHLLAFDLFGGPERLSAALSDLEGLAPTRVQTKAWRASLHARLSARSARLSDADDGLMDAAALLDSAVHESRGLSGPAIDDLRLERAAVSLEAGVARWDARLLDQAGRDLRAMVAACASDQRPLTRARALALAGAGLRALADLAGDEAGALNGRALFDAAADQFTADHSPLDWVAVRLARADEPTSLACLTRCEALTRQPGLILGALARERRVAAETTLAAAMRDAGALVDLEQATLARLAAPTLTPLDWAAEQIGLARLAAARARLAGGEPRAVGMMLAEAALTAREQGVPVLAERARAAQAETAPA